MVTWNLKLFLLAVAATPSSSAFFVPFGIPKHHDVLRSTPDQWLGSSPSDHYGGAVGPRFERMDGGKKRTTANITPLDWNGGTMEAGFNQKQQQVQQTPPQGPPEHVQSGKSYYPTKPKEQEVSQAINWDDGSGSNVKPKWIPSGHYDTPFETKAVPKPREYSTLKQRTPAGQPKVIGYEGPSEKAPKVSTSSEDWKQNHHQQQSSGDSEGIEPLSWDDGSVANVKPKWIPSGHYDTPFETKAVPKPREYSTLQQRTPAGQPKMIGYEKPVEKAKPAQATQTATNEGELPPIIPNELETKQGRRPPAEGFPISEFRSIPDQPGEWFYHDVSTGQPRPAWPGLRQEQMKQSESFQDNGSMEAGLGHEPKVPNQEPKYEKPKASKLADDEAAAAAAAAAVETKISAPLQQATPPGQPKLIRQDLWESAAVAQEENMAEPEESAQEEEQRLPPAEGFPISGFRSTPDQPGEWFYHDVKQTGSAPPAWPHLQKQQTVYSFQDGGSMQKGLGHERRAEKPDHP